MINDSSLKLIAHMCSQEITKKYNIAVVKNSTEDGTYTNFVTRSIISKAIAQLDLQISSSDTDTIDRIKNDAKFEQYLIEQLTITVQGIRLFY